MVCLWTFYFVPLIYFTYSYTNILLSWLLMFYSGSSNQVIKNLPTFLSHFEIVLAVLDHLCVYINIRISLFLLKKLLIFKIVHVKSVD